MIRVPSRFTTGRFAANRAARLEFLSMDVEPDIELGPIREGKHTNAFALALAPL